MVILKDPGEVKGGLWHLYWAGGRKDPLLSDMLHETERYFKLNFPFLPSKQITAKTYEHLQIPHMFGIVDRGRLHKLYLESRKSELPVVERSIRQSTKSFNNSLPFPLKKKLIPTKVVNRTLSGKKYQPLMGKSPVDKSVVLKETPTSLGSRKSVTFHDGVNVIDISPNPLRNSLLKRQVNPPTRRSLSKPKNLMKSISLQVDESIPRQKVLSQPELNAPEETISARVATNGDDSENVCPSSTLIGNEQQEENNHQIGKIYVGKENDSINAPEADISVKSNKLKSIEKDVSSRTVFIDNSSNHEQYNDQTLFLNNFSLGRHALNNKDEIEKCEKSQQLEIIESDGEINRLPKRKTCKIRKLSKRKINARQLKHKNKTSSDSLIIDESLNDTSKSTTSIKTNNTDLLENLKVIDERNCVNAELEIQSNEEDADFNNNKPLNETIPNDTSLLETLDVTDEICMSPSPNNSKISPIRNSECDFPLIENTPKNPANFNTVLQESSNNGKENLNSHTILVNSPRSSISLNEEPKYPNTLEQTPGSPSSQNQSFPYSQIQLNQEILTHRETQSNDTHAISPSIPKEYTPEQFIEEYMPYQNLQIPEQNDTVLPRNNFSPISESSSLKSAKSVSCNSDENSNESGQISNSIFKHNNFRGSVIAHLRDSDESLSDTYSHSQESIGVTILEENTSQLYNDSMSFLSKATNCLTINDMGIIRNKLKYDISPNFFKEKELVNEIDNGIEKNQDELLLTREENEIQRTKSSTVSFSVTYDSSQSFENRTIESLNKNKNPVSPNKMSCQMKEIIQDLDISESDSSINLSQNKTSIPNNESIDEVSTAYETEKETGKLKISKYLDKKRIEPNVNDEITNTYIQTDIDEIHSNPDRGNTSVSPKKNDLIQTGTLKHDKHNQHGNTTGVKSTIVNLGEINEYHLSSGELSESGDIWSEQSGVSESISQYQENREVSNLQGNKNSGIRSQSNEYLASLADEINKENHEYFDDKKMFLTKWVLSNNKIKIQDQNSKTSNEIYCTENKLKHNYKVMYDKDNILSRNTFDDDIDEGNFKNTQLEEDYCKVVVCSPQDPSKEEDTSESIISQSYSEGIIDSKNNLQLSLSSSFLPTCNTPGAQSPKSDLESASNLKLELQIIASSEQKSSVSIIENSDSIDNKKEGTTQTKFLGIFHGDLRAGEMIQEIKNTEDEHKDTFTESDTLINPIEKHLITTKSNINENNKNIITPSQELISLNIERNDLNYVKKLSKNPSDKFINIKIEPEVSDNNSVIDESLITSKSSPSIISPEEIPCRKKKNIKKRKTRAKLLKNQLEIIQISSSSEEEVRKRPSWRRANGRHIFKRASIDQSDFDELDIRKEDNQLQEDGTKDTFNGSRYKVEKSAIISSETVNEFEKVNSQRNYSDKPEIKLTPIVISQRHTKITSNIVNKTMDSSEMKMRSDSGISKQYDDQERLKYIQNKSRILAKELIASQESKISSRKILPVTKKYITQEENSITADPVNGSLRPMTGTLTKHNPPHVNKPISMREALKFDKWYRSHVDTKSNSSSIQDSINRNSENKNCLLQSNGNEVLENISNSKNSMKFRQQDEPTCINFQNDNALPLIQKQLFRNDIIINDNKNTPIKSKRQPLQDISNDSSNNSVIKKNSYVSDDSNRVKETRLPHYTKSHVTLRNVNSADHNFDNTSPSELSRKRKLNAEHIEEKKSKLSEASNLLLREISFSSGSLRKMDTGEEEESIRKWVQSSKYSKSSTVRRMEMSAHNTSSSPQVETLLRRSFFMEKPSE